MALYKTFFERYKNNRIVLYIIKFLKRQKTTLCCSRFCFVVLFFHFSYFFFIFHSSTPLASFFFLCLEFLDIFLLLLLMILILCLYHTLDRNWVCYTTGRGTGTGTATTPAKPLCPVQSSPVPPELESESSFFLILIIRFYLFKLFSLDWIWLL